MKLILLLLVIREEMMYNKYIYQDPYTIAITAIKKNQVEKANLLNERSKLYDQKDKLEDERDAAYENQKKSRSNNKYGTIEKIDERIAEIEYQQSIFI